MIINFLFKWLTSIIRNYVFALIAISYICIIDYSSSLACEPCFKELDLNETYQKADLVIIGRKTADGIKLSPSDSHIGPEWIEVQTSKIIKGESDSDHLKINSWQAMCDGYGIVIDEKLYIIFLEKKSPPKDFTWDDYAYDAVNFGCSVKTLLIEDNKVYLNNEKIPLEDFVIQLQQF